MSDYYECPDCGFQFHKDHEDVSGGYSCPVCINKELYEALKEVFELLGEYVPRWYTNGHYNRMKAALDKVEDKNHEKQVEPVEQCQGCGLPIYPLELVWIYEGRAYCKCVTCLIKAGYKPGDPVTVMTVEEWLDRE